MKKSRLKTGSVFLWAFFPIKTLLLRQMMAWVLISVTAFNLQAKDSLPEGEKISLIKKLATIKEILKEIEDQTDFSFFYNHQQIDVDKTISISLKEVTLVEALKEIFKSTSIKYKISGHQILLFKDVTSRHDSHGLLHVEFREKEPEYLAGLFTISGTVTASSGETMPGVNVFQKGTTIGTTTDVEGRYSLVLEDPDAILVFSFIGYTTQEIPVNGRSVIDVTLVEDMQTLEEVVVVGYGVQKKESAVGSIGMTTSKELERRGINSSLSSALSGQVPGVMVMERTGEPGLNDPKILIRGQSTWNNAQPLILVDGVERKMVDLDINEVATVSVLKDASATAVFGVKGANGVILITTKRGKVGPAKLEMTADYGIKNISKIFNVVDAYQGIRIKNAAIAHEVSVNESAWGYYLPAEELNRYKKPQQYPYNYLYPNVDWADEMTNDYASAYRMSMNVSGGTESAKYFGLLSYIHEGDILASEYNQAKGYDPGYAYDRFNFRGNVDLKLTNTTDLGVNLSGYMGVKKHTMAHSTRWMYGAMYSLPPDAFPVRYEDGVYGKHPNDINLHNPIAILNEAGVRRVNRSQIASDLKLKQNLDFLTKGLSATGRISYDLYFSSEGPNINEGSNQGQTIYKHIDPSILNAESAEDSLAAITYFSSIGNLSVNEFDWVAQPWTIQPEEIKNSSLSRALFYQLSLNYARTFDKHNVTGLFLFNRRENATGPEFKNYREDWVGRVTYAYDGKYLAEVNGAYNGSEKFAPKYRFGFFPSVALGWRLSEEPFMDFNWLENLKIRGSYGKVGSDAGIPRWGYQGSWIRGPKDTRFTNDEGRFNLRSPHAQHFQGVIPNPDLNWETAIKRNLGLELGVLRGSVSLEVDVFKNNRENIFMSGNRRNIPAIFGAPPVPANLGKTETTGYEVVLNLRKTIGSNLDLWGTFSMTRARDVILKAEDPELLPDYLKETGYAIGQTRSQIRNGFMNNWDDVFASAPLENNRFKLPGDWDIIDFNADGLINSFDEIPYGFPSRPQNTYSATVGFDYQRFSVVVQFYGVTNIHQSVGLASPSPNFATVSEYFVDYWTPDNTDAFYKAPRIVSGSPNGDLFRFDGSFLRLKTAEISYTMPGQWISHVGLSDVRIYVNGNNLLYWSDLPHDSETGSFNLFTAYPMFRRINMGINIGF